MDLTDEETRSLLGGNIASIEENMGDGEADVQPDELEMYLKKFVYVSERLPDDYITPEMLLELNELSSVSSLSSISEDALEELDTDMQAEGFIKNDKTGDEEKLLSEKSIRDLFYRLMFTKHKKYRTRINENLDDVTNKDSDVEDTHEEVESDDDKEEKPLGDTKRTNEEKTEERDAEFMWKKKKSRNHTGVFIDKYPTNKFLDLLKSDIDEPPPEVSDQFNVKSLKTIMEENYKSDNGRTYALHAIICIFSYDCHPLNNDSELPIEHEIVDMIYNLNYNTLKPSDSTSIINGCVIVNNGLGIVCFELSMIDLIRLVSTVNWSLFSQKVTKIKIFTNISFTTSRFRTFMMCRPLMVEDDDRDFPQFIEEENEDEERSLQIRTYLKEMSDKLGQTIDILGGQSEFHDCGVGELPPCAAEHLPSKPLLRWVLDCPILKSWDCLVSEMLEPMDYYDFTNESYPFPTDSLNLRNILFMEQHRDKLFEFYKKGYRPNFNECGSPEIPIPPFFKDPVDKIYRGHQKFVPMDIDLNLK